MDPCRQTPCKTSPKSLSSFSWLPRVLSAAGNPNIFQARCPSDVSSNLENGLNWWKQNPLWSINKRIGPFWCPWLIRCPSDSFYSLVVLDVCYCIDRKLILWFSYWQTSNFQGVCHANKFTKVFFSGVTFDIIIIDVINVIHWLGKDLWTNHWESDRGGGGWGGKKNKIHGLGWAELRW